MQHWCEDVSVPENPGPNDLRKKENPPSLDAASSVAAHRGPQTLTIAVKILYKMTQLLTSHSLSVWVNRPFRETGNKWVKMHVSPVWTSFASHLSSLFAALRCSGWVSSGREKALPATKCLHALCVSLKRDDLLSLSREMQLRKTVPEDWDDKSLCRWLVICSKLWEFDVPLPSFRTAILLLQHHI